MPFLSLPSEVIHRVAIHCGGKEIQALVCTCRFLRDLCDDALVYEQSFQLNVPDPASHWFVSRGSVLYQMIKVRLAQEDPVTRKAIWTKLAVAIGMLEDLPLHFDRLLGEYRGILTDKSTYGLPFTMKTERAVANLVGLLTDLTVYGLPINDPSSLEHLACIARISYPDRSTSKDATQRAFCLAAGLLFHKINDPSIGISTFGLGPRLLHTPLHTRDDIWTGGVDARRTRALLALSVVASLPFPPLGEGSPVPPPIFQRLPAAIIPPPPALYSLPWAMRPLPLPCIPSPSKADEMASRDPDMDRLTGFGSTVVWTDWLSTRVEELVTATSRNDLGEWHGYLTYGLGETPPARSFWGRPSPPHPGTDALMGVRVYPVEAGSATYQSASDDTGMMQQDCRIDSSGGPGTDGPSWLVGAKLFRPAGQFILGIAAPGLGSDWQLDGMMTPLGFAGWWRNNWLETDPAGLFWLWKKEWMDQN